MTAVLTFDNVTHHMDENASVRDINFALDEGEILCLLGPSGCGKSTTLRLAAGLEQPDAGSISLHGQLAANSNWQLPPEKRQMGMVFQDYALFPHLTAYENVAFGLRHLADAEKKRRAQLLFNRLHIKHLWDQHPHTLSGGEMQRVALARALAPIPRIVLLDEPFSELDPQLRGDIRDDTLHILKEVGTAAIMVTHDAEEAMFMADRIAVMKQGRIIQIDSPMQLYNRPIDPFSASFFGEINSFESRLEGGLAQSPFGPVMSRGVAEGVDVHVVLRAESVGFAEVGSAGEAVGMCQVVASRMLGRVSLVHVSYVDKDKQQHHLHGRIPGIFLPVVGKELHLTVDIGKALVFERK